MPAQHVLLVRSFFIPALFALHVSPSLYKAVFLAANSCRGHSHTMSATHRHRLTQSSDSVGFLNERVLLLLFECMKWDIRTLCRAAAVNRRLRAVAKRLLWRELCHFRAPRMMSTLTEGATNSTIIGGWPALAKLLYYCGGCESTRNFRLSRPSPGHFVETSRFSKTSGRSFLTKSCRGDVLYVSDPCEHAAAAGEVRADDVGIYRGVFREFMKSRTRDCLIRKQVEFEEGVRCPYCAARVWSMTAARLIPRQSVARRLGSSDGSSEYFVCLNGHLHGTCWLVPLSASDDDGGGADEDDECSMSSGGGDDSACRNHVGRPSNGS